MGSPLQTHWHVVLRILWYLKSTLGLGILYIADQDISQDVALFGWMDLDWTSNMDSHYLNTGYCFTLGSGAISWSSNKQPTIALSSTEAKYMVVYSETCKALWLWRLLKDLGFSQERLSLVLCDN